MDAVLYLSEQPGYWVHNMSKGMDSKAAKKKPAKTADEKRADKKAKTDTGLFGH